MEACVGSAWGAIAGNVQDAPSCVRGCRDSLRRLLAPDEDTYVVFCRTLVQLDQPQMYDMLLGLYCCDAQLCGVDNIALPGFDPNVDLLINVCASLGFGPIRDPGPPPATHICINTLLPSSDISCSRTVIFPTIVYPTSYQTTPISTTASTTTENSASTTTDSTALTTTTSTASTSQRSTSSTSRQSTFSTTESTPSSTTMQSTTEITDSSSSTTVISTAMSSTTGTGAVPPTITSLVDPQLSNNISGGSKDNASGGLSTVAKIIIAAAVSGAILVAIIAVLWHCRYRRKNREPEPTGNYQPSLILVPPISPNSPLMTPSPSYLGRDGAPLTPPPRLQERRLLPSASSEQLVERGPSRLRQGFHLPTGSRANLNSPYGSTVSPAFAMAAVVAGERQPSAPQSANHVGTPYASPTRSQFATISYASSLADPGPPPDRELPTTPARVATAQSRSRSHVSVSPNAIGVALAFPRQEDDLSAQVSNESGQSSESKIMTGPMRGSWGENMVVSGSEEAPAQLAPRTQATRRTSRSPILEEQELARMAGSY